MFVLKILGNIKFNKKSLLILLYLIILVVFSISKIYLNVAVNAKEEIDIHNGSITKDSYTSKYKLEVKRKLHLNIFDYDVFKTLQNRDIKDSGTCVQTRIEVSVFINSTREGGGENCKCYRNYKATISLILL